MRPTDILIKEHDAIKVMLRILESACHKLESGENVDAKHLLLMVEFIREFADRCHHGKEEDLLFPAMQEAGIPKEGGPIGVMLHEHEQGRAFVKSLGEGIARYTADDKESVAGIIENARGYFNLLSHHIFKEDNVLFPMAAKLIPEGIQARLIDEFEKVEIEKFGRGRHEQLHRILESLKAIYLK